MKYLESGVSKAKIGDHKGAIADFNKGLKLDPDDVRLYLAKGISIAQLKDNNRGQLALDNDTGQNHISINSN